MVDHMPLFNHSSLFYIIAQVVGNIAMDVSLLGLGLLEEHSVIWVFHQHLKLQAKTSIFCSCCFFRSLDT